MSERISGSKKADEKNEVERLVFDVTRDCYLMGSRELMTGDVFEVLLWDDYENRPRWMLSILNFDPLTTGRDRNMRGWYLLGHPDLEIEGLFARKQSGNADNEETERDKRALHVAVQLSNELIDILSDVERDLTAKVPDIAKDQPPTIRNNEQGYREGIRVGIAALVDGIRDHMAEYVARFADTLIDSESFQ